MVMTSDFYHGGKFVLKKNKCEYVGGGMLLKVEMDEVCYFNLAHVVKSELEYEEVGELWYKRHGLSLLKGRAQMVDDTHIEALLNSKDNVGFINVYVIHPPKQVDPNPQADDEWDEGEEPFLGLFKDLGIEEQYVSSQHNKRAEKLQVRRGPLTLSSTNNPTISHSLAPSKTAPSKTHTKKSHTKQTATTTPVTPTTANTTHETPATESDAVRKSRRRRGKGIEYHDPEAESESDGSDLEPVLSDNDYDNREDGDLFNANVDDDLLDSVLGSVGDGMQGGWQFEEGEEKDDEIFYESDAEVLSDEEDLRSLHGSDDEEADHYPVFNPNVDFKREVKLTLGLKFPTNKVFRKALRHHAIDEGYDYYLLHNGSKRVSVYCKHRCACPWQNGKAKLGACVCDEPNRCKFKVHTTKLKGEETFQIKSLFLNHSCGWHDVNSKVTSQYLAERWLHYFRAQDNFKIETFRELASSKCGVDIGYYKAYFAKKKALRMINGTSEMQFKRVWDYASILKEKNPGTSVFIKLVNIESPPPLFQRMYVCIQACKEGFMVGCRPILGVDGCHLKGPFSGILLTAVGKDANSNIFPIAWAVVEVENSDSWTWFLELLKADLGSVAEEITYIKENAQNMAIMSDRQKGLLEAFQRVMPNAEIRFCCRHIWANFSKHFAGEAFKNVFWKAARAFTQADFNVAMEEMKELSLEAWEYLDKIPTKNWSRHAFSSRSRSAMLLNNACESFNHVLKPARDKSILTMLEWIRRYVMTRMYNKRVGAEKYEGKLMPSVMKQLEAIHKEQKDCKVLRGAFNEFEVSDAKSSYVVDLNSRTCTCYKWDLTGVPCAHAFACIMKRRKQPVDFVHYYYSVEAYSKTFAPVVKPLPGMTHWPKTKHPQPSPPPLKKLPGGPSKKNRRKEPGEGQEMRKRKDLVKRKRKQNQCSNCGQLGHYKSRCKNPTLPKQPVSKGGRPRSNEEDLLRQRFPSSQVPTNTSQSFEAAHTSTTAQSSHGAVHYSPTAQASPATSAGHSSLAGHYSHVTHIGHSSHAAQFSTVCQVWQEQQLQSSQTTSVTSSHPELSRLSQSQSQKSQHAGNQSRQGNGTMMFVSQAAKRRKIDTSANVVQRPIWRP